MLQEGQSTLQTTYSRCGFVPGFPFRHRTSPLQAIRPAALFSPSSCTQAAQLFHEIKVLKRSNFLFGLFEMNRLLRQMPFCLIFFWHWKCWKRKPRALIFFLFPWLFLPLPQMPFYWACFWNWRCWNREPRLLIFFLFPRPFLSLIINSPRY